MTMFYSIEFPMNANTIVFTFEKINHSTKCMVKVARETLSKFKLIIDVNVILVFNFI